MSVIPFPSRIKLIDMARLAYSTYARSMKDTNAQGLPLRDFQQLDLREQDAWIAVVTMHERSRERFVSRA